jgi:NTP pyrophosphatase (non-canonical NTP hydrolase)
MMKVEILNILAVMMNCTNEELVRKAETELEVLKEKADKWGTECIKLNEFAKDVHQNAIAHGWWETERSFGEIIALCHSELSEALEEHRHNRPILYTACKMEDLKANGGGGCGVCAYCAANKPEGIASELADCIIRILDYCEFAGIDIEQVLKQKHEYNKTRPYRHGGKAL